MKGFIKNQESNYRANTINAQMALLLENPKNFLNNIDQFHHQLLVNSIEPFYSIWYGRVVVLKQKPAKAKRKEYVLAGYETLKLELMELKATTYEIKLVDNKIEKLKSEDWCLI